MVKKINRISKVTNEINAHSINRDYNRLICNYVKIEKNKILNKYNNYTSRFSVKKNSCIY